MKKQYEYFRFAKTFTEFYDSAHLVARVFLKTLYGDIKVKEGIVNDVVFLDTEFKFNVLNPTNFESRTFTLPSKWLGLELSQLKAQLNSYTTEQLEEMGV